jgi:predicted GIY-YIG superfamily endonuclease
MNLAEYAREPICEDSVSQLKEQLESSQVAFWSEYTMKELWMERAITWMARALEAEKQLKELTSKDK